MKNLENKRLLLLGGSLWKDSIKDFADYHNIYLVVVGNNPNAGIFEIADEHYIVDSTNYNDMKRLIVDKNIDGVYMGGSEVVIEAAIKYLNDLNMPCYAKESQWNSLQDKLEFKKILNKFGLPNVKNYSIILEQIKSENINISFPVITKPADGSGSSGFSVCYDFNELGEGYIKAEKNSPTKSVIVEDYVDNSGVVVIYTFTNGKMIFSGIEDKYPVKYDKHGSYVAGLFVYQSKLKEKFRKQFEPKLEKMFNYLEIKEGSIWIEVFSDGNKFYFNEAGFRMGGSASAYPVDYFYNINQIGSDIYYALTNESEIYNHIPLVDLKKDKEKYGVYAIHLHPGKISRIEGLNELYNVPNFVVFPLMKNVGDTILNVGTISQVLGFVHFTFNTVDECKETIELIHKTLKVYDEKSNEMSNRLLDLNKIKL